MSSEQGLTAADVITPYCRYSGLIDTGGRRLADILGDVNLDILEMQQTLVTAVGVRSTEVRCGQLFLQKEYLSMVIPKGTHEAPIRRRNNYQKRLRYGAVIMLHGHVISGVLYLPERKKLQTLLGDEGSLPAFFGITDVTIRSSLHGLVPSQCQTAIIRRQAIEAIQLTTQSLPEPEREEVAQA